MLFSSFLTTVIWLITLQYVTTQSVFNSDDFDRKNRDGEKPSFPIMEDFRRQTGLITDAHEVLRVALRDFLDWKDSNLTLYINKMRNQSEPFYDEFDQIIPHYKKVFRFISEQVDEVRLGNYAVKQFDKDRYDLCSVARYLSNQMKYPNRQEIVGLMGKALGQDCDPCIPYRRKEHDKRNLSDRLENQHPISVARRRRSNTPCPKESSQGTAVPITTSTPLNKESTATTTTTTASTTTSTGIKIAANDGFRLVCYFPSWALYIPGNGAFHVKDIDPNLCTHYIYAFAVLNGTRIEPFDRYANIDQGGFTDFVAMKRRNKAIKTLISVQDNQMTFKDYSIMVQSEDTINQFVDSALSFLGKYGFDGLDIYWLWPDDTVNDSDKIGYANLITALSKAFKPKGLVLSAFVPSAREYINKGFDVDILGEMVDFVNVNTYDMHGPGWEREKADHHAPLYRRSWEWEFANTVDSSIKYWTSKGFPTIKMNLGIRLYGSTWTLTSADNTVPPDVSASGPGEPGPISNQAGVLRYYEICSKLVNESWIEVRDSLNQTGPYAYSPKTLQWVCYDDPAFATVKSEYLASMGLGGAMIWNLSDDDFRNTCGYGANPIITAIAKTLKAQKLPTMKQAVV